MFKFWKRKKDIKENPASQVTEEKAEEIIEEPTEEIIEEPTEKVIEEPVEEIVEEPTEEVIEETAEEVIEEPVEEAIEEPTEEVIEEPAEEAIEEPTEEVKEESEAPKLGFFAKLKAGLGKTRDALNEKVDNVLKIFKKIDEELYEELEEALIMADVGVETSTYIIEELRKKVKEKKLTESEQVKGEIQEIVADILGGNDNSLKLETTPSVIMVIGVNGVGKTTSIGKIAAKYMSQGKKVLLGAADTFRAAAIDQLRIWAERVGADIICHEEGSDPASVVFDTIAAAKSRKSDVIIIDTAGRLHNKKNLMDELAKISRIIERELPGCSRETLLVLDATTGQNAVNQAEVFKESASISGIILTKLDGSAKGGIVLAIAHEHAIPVKLVGVGEGIDDLQEFSATDFANAMIGE